MSLSIKEFRQPGNWWRSAPFWSWNDTLTPKGVRQAAADLLKGGMGGYFCHSRWGLETEYFSPRWMECIRAAVAEAKKRGAYCWLYDEDRWPSGAAGGQVTIPHPEFRAKSLIAEWPPDGVLANLAKGQKIDKAIIARFAVRGAPGKLRSFRRLGKDAWPRRGERALRFCRLVNPDTDWYNRGAYLDNMDPKAVRAFIDHTYEGYRKAVGREFGKTIPGIFTDEPNYHQPYHSGVGERFLQVPWTDRLPAEFRKRCGYDLLSQLPHLYFEAGARGLKVRRDFRKVCAELFEEAFSRQIGRWCARHKLPLTGHYLAEQTLEAQTQVIGAAMPHYVHMHMPGIDILRRSISEVLTCKQASSIAEQFGRRRVLSETYGGAGWHFSLADQKWMGDWQYALGVNLRCQHLVLTSLRGGAKRDYPPSFFPNNPSWRHNNVAEDYFGRLSYTLSQGRAVRDLLVIHPIESAWALYTSDAKAAPRKQLAKLDRKFAGLLEQLLGLHRDFDLGDESVLAKHGKARRGELAVGRARYKAVLVPECLSLRKSTLKLLRSFAAKGGKVLFLGSPPGLLDGARSAEPAKVLRRIGKRVSARRASAFAALLGRALDDALPPRLSVKSAGRECAAVIYMLRKVGNRQVLFLANRDFDRGRELGLTLAGAPAGAAEEWDLETGKVRRLEAARADGIWKAKLKLPATGSKLLAFGPASGKARAAEAELRAVERTEVGRGGWRFRRDEPNALVLDLCRWRLRDGALSEPTHMRHAEEDIRRELGYSRPLNQGVMRWKQYLPEDLARERADGPRVEISFEFQVTKAPAGRFALAIERPRRFRIFLNGREVPARPEGSYVDPAIETLPLPAPRRGRNCLRLVTGYRPEHNLEDVCLIGDFGVASTARRELIAEPQALKRGSWTKQGYAHYGGAITYVADVALARPARGQRTFLTAPRPAGTSMELAVNGRRVGAMPWPPYELEVTRFLRAGRNRVELTVIGSRRNLFGPLHGTRPEPNFVGPRSFVAPDGRERIYNLLDHGLTGRVYLERRAPRQQLSP